VKLIWIAKQASEVSISVISGADSKQELRGLDAVGERIFHPLVSARYTITVKGLFGRTASKVLDVDVESTH
jgi:hypothetical protein